MTRSADGIQIAHHGGDAGGRGALLHLHQFHQRRGFEGALPGEDLVEQQAERVDIAPHRDFGARQLLRRHVGRSAAAHVALQLLGEAGESEIHDDDLAAAVDHHVGRFQVAVQHAFFVGGGQAGAELARGLDRLVHGQASDAAQQRAEILAIHELHGDVVQAFGDADVVDAADVGVRDLARDADFVVEAREGAIVGGGGLGQEFQGHGLAQGQVGGAIDFAHAAASQQSRDAVAPGHHGARQEAAFIDGAGGAEAGRSGGAGSEDDGLGGSGVERRRAGGAIAAVLRAFARAGRTSDHRGRSILARRERGRGGEISVWNGDFADGEYRVGWARWCEVIVPSPELALLSIGGFPAN